MLCLGFCVCCAKHNQHTKYAKARGVWGHAPQKYLKITCSEIDFGDNSTRKSSSNIPLNTCIIIPYN